MKRDEKDVEETTTRELRLWREQPPTDDVQLRWIIFHEANPGVYDLLVKFTREAFRAASARGRDLKRYGIQAVAERARWFVFFEAASEEDFKLPNEFLSRYAREIMTREADLRGAFELRTLQTVTHPTQKKETSEHENSHNENKLEEVGSVEEVGR